MMRIRKKTLDKATENALSQAAAAGIPLPFDRYEDQVPVCRFGQMGLDCKVCTQGPCRVNPFDSSHGTACGRDREGIVAANFLRLVADGAVASAAYAGAESKTSGTIFDGISAANEGVLSAAQLLAMAVEVAGAGFGALAGAKASGEVQTVEVGVGALKAEKINILLVGGIPLAQTREIAAQLKAKGNVQVVGSAGAEFPGLDIAGSYNSEEALLVTTGIDGIVAGKGCVAPGLVALAAQQGVPVMAADQFNAGKLLDSADTHYRRNAGRNLASKFAPSKAVVGFTAASFSSVSNGHWADLSKTGIKGIALVGGCNNAMETQDAAIVRQAGEFLRNDMLVIATGCAAAGLAKAGYMDPAKVASVAGEGLQAFLSALSETTGTAVPAVLSAGSCWETPAALETAKLLSQKMNLPLGAAMPELSRPAGWSSALSIAAQGVPTYVGPVLPLDGGMETVQTLNGLLEVKGGALVGPGQVGDPEAFVGKVLGQNA